MLGPAKATTTTTGTGNLTFSSVTGFPTPNDVVPSSVGRLAPYTILDSNGYPIEWGIGHCATSSTWARDIVLGTYSSSTYTDVSPSAISLSAGTYTLIIADGPSQYVDRAGVPNNSPKTLVVPVPVCIGGSLQNLAAAYTSELQFYPFSLRIFAQLHSVSVYISVADTTPGNMQFGIYTVGANGLPDVPLVDSGSVSMATTGMKTYTLSSDIILSPGRYFAVMNRDGTVGKVVGYCIGEHSWVGYSGNNFPSNKCRLTGVRSVGTALPTAPSGTWAPKGDYYNEYFYLGLT